MDDQGAEFDTNCVECGEPFRMVMVDGRLLCTKDGLRPVMGSHGHYVHASCHLGQVVDEVYS